MGPECFGSTGDLRGKAAIRTGPGDSPFRGQDTRVANQNFSGADTRLPNESCFPRAANAKQ